MTGSVDIVANSISLIKPDGTLQSLTLGGTIAPVNDPQFTGTVQGVSKVSVGLGNVDNTSDLNKPISTIVQAAFDLKAPTANPNLTGTAKAVNLTLTGNISTPSLNLNGTSLSTVLGNLGVYFADASIFSNTINVGVLVVVL